MGDCFLEQTGDWVHIRVLYGPSGPRAMGCLTVPPRVASRCVVPGRPAVPRSWPRPGTIVGPGWHGTKVVVLGRARVGPKRMLGRPMDLAPYDHLYLDQEKAVF